MNFQATALLGILVAASFGMHALAQTGATPAARTDVRFIGFPHEGRVVAISAYDDRDEAAARRHYEALFLGRSLAEVEAACAEEMRREEAGTHDAHTIRCRPIDDRRYRIAYRFDLQTPDTPYPMAAVVWDIELAVEKGVVGAVQAKAGILAP